MIREVPSPPPLTLDEIRGRTSPALTVTDVSRFTGLDERTVRRGCENGDLPCVRIGRRLLIPRLPLLALFGAHTPDMDGAGPASPAATTTDEAAKEPRNVEYAAGAGRSA